MEKRKKRKDDESAKDKVRQRMHVRLDPDNYQYFPVTIKRTDYYDDEVEQDVGIYVRVSTNDIKQTTSYELQKIYYEDFVRKHPNWKLIDIYADMKIANAIQPIISSLLCQRGGRFTDEGVRNVDIQKNGAEGW